MCVHYGSDNCSTWPEIKEWRSKERKAYFAKYGHPHLGQHWKWSKEDRLRFSELRLSISQKGKDHHNWKGGISKSLYPAKFNRLLKISIKERDHYKCWLCGISEKQHLKLYKRPLYVNHIDFDKNNCEMNNLNSLCAKCNSIINYDRKFWTKHFQKLIKELKY